MSEWEDLEPSQNAVLRMATNEPSLLPKRRSEPIEHYRSMRVEFTCTTPECQSKETVIAYTQNRGPSNATYDAQWTEIACVRCGARYLIGWPASPGNGETTVQRIEA